MISALMHVHQAKGDTGLGVILITAAVTWLGALPLSEKWRRMNTNLFPYGMAFSVPIVAALGALGVLTLTLHW